jgi:hypothetical protein
VDISIKGDIDGRSLGSVEVDGVRSVQDYRWLAYVATSERLGQFGAAVLGSSAWRLEPGTGWQATDAASLHRDTLDMPVHEVPMQRGSRTASEMLGLSYFEGARARHCRIAIDGPTFRRAFPQAYYLIGDADVTRWRGELDYWVFADGELGRASAVISGEPVGLAKGGLQAHFQATLIATERDAPHPIEPPG